ncbi:MAG: hypothetical protein ACRC68_16230, partial [Clostridium sp.]
MRERFKPFIFTKCTTKNILMNNITWGLLVSLNFILLYLVTTNQNNHDGVAGIKTVPGFLIIGPLLWIL